MTTGLHLRPARYMAGGIAAAGGYTASGDASDYVKLSGQQKSDSGVYHHVSSGCGIVV